MKLINTYITTLELGENNSLYCYTGKDHDFHHHLIHAEKKPFKMVYITHLVSTHH